MAEPKQARTDSSGKRFYGWKGESYWSVTTILSAMPKPALPVWAAKVVAEYAVDHLDALSALERDAALDLLKRVPDRQKNKGGEMGSAVHDAIEAYWTGRPKPVAPIDVRARMRAFHQFVGDYSPEFVPQMAEASVFNRTKKYAGTLDAILKIRLPRHRATRWLLDVKSGKGVYPEVGLQLAAYRYAEFIGMPDGSERKMPPVAGGLVLHLPESGGYLLREVRCDEMMLRVFEYVREVYRFQTEIRRSVFIQDYEPKEKN